MYPGPDGQDAQCSTYLYIAYNITINMELLNASVLPMLVGLFFFLQSRIHLDIKVIYKAPGLEDKSRPVSSNAEVVATVMPLS